jgi:predicted AlkP superfamily phosphohydrolase/phosphomutase
LECGSLLPPSNRKKAAASCRTPRRLRRILVKPAGETPALPVECPRSGGFAAEDFTMVSGQSSKKRACVIGLDGVPCGLLLKMAAGGVMPSINGLLQKHALRKMKASLPEVSSVSWTSFMTGANPGEHGIFGFTDFRERSYQIRFPNSLDVKSPAIWDRLGRKGLKSIVINQPSTYPAQKIDGALVAGFVAVELARAVYPLSHLAVLEKMNYQMDIDTEKARRDHEVLWRELDSTLEGGRKAFQYFWPQAWDLFEFIVTGTDRLQHYLWNACDDPTHPDHARFFEYYRKVDQLVGEIVEKYQELTGGLKGLYLLSDHGFTGIVQEVNLNAWLQNSGYLFFDTPAAQRISEIGPGTRAFALDPNRIYLNVKGRFPRGTLEKKDVPALKSEIAAALLELKCDNRKVVRQVFDAEGIYSGPHVGKGPDLIVLSEYGFDMKGSVGGKDIFGRSDLQGMHTWDDAFVWTLRECGADPVISDLASLILEEFA